MKKNGIALAIILSVVICLLACVFTACDITFDLGTDITITFMVDGEVYHEMEVKNDKTVRMPAEPEKDGYVFAGWYLSEDYEEVFTSSYLRNNTVVSDITVYAKWVTDDNQPPQGTFTIHFNSMGGSEVADIVLSEGATFVLPDDPTKTGYTFAGWYLDESYQTIFESTSQLIDGIVLYAKWVEEHEHSYTTTTLDPDCENDGYTRHSCKCGYYYDDEIVPATGHTWKWIIDQNATVTESGLKHEECSVCHAKQNENTVIDPLDCSHEGTLIHHAKVDATCTEDGTIEYWHCTACDKKYLDAAGQVLAGTLTIPSAGGHKSTDWIVDIEATCTEDGSKHKECSVCHNTLETEVIPAGHTPAQAVVENMNQATCTEAGSFDKVVYCVECGTEISRENKTIEPSHKIVEHEGQEETCTENGWKPYQTCSRCEYTTYETIPAQHKIIEHDGKAPTCTEIGWDAYVTCSRCEHTTYVENPATGHSHDAVVTAPTCTEAGYTTYTCHCGDRYVADEVPAIGHTPSEAVIENNIDATCTTDGSYDSVVYCATCGEELSRETVTVDATGHNFENNEYCSVCSAEYYTEGLQFALSNDEYIVTGVTTNETDITIPSVYQGLPVVGIADEAFYGNSNIFTVEIPASVTSIDDYAFYECISLTNVAFGEHSQLTYIGSGAFYRCNSLTSITIPDSVTLINGGAFVLCDCLAEVYNYSSLNIIKGSRDYGYVGFYALDIYTTNDPSKLKNNGGLIIHSNGTLVKCIGTATEITIPDSVTSIGDYAFYRNSSLTSLTFGENSQLTSIGDYAFYECTSLTNVAFGEHSQLTYIGSEAFYRCNSLTSITIPDSVIWINSSAFNRCEGLTSVIFEDTTNWSMSINGDLIDVTDVASNAKDLKTYVNDWYKADENGFAIANNGDEIVLRKYFGTATEVVIPDNVTTIYSTAFYFCDNLTSITIPASVMGIAAGTAFYRCNNLTNIIVDENNPNFKSIDGNLYTKNGKSLIKYAAGKTESTFNIPDSVTDISRGAFDGCSNLSSITIPASVTNIWGDAFNLCTSLTNVYYLGTLEQWCDVFFAYDKSNPMYYADNLYIDGKLLEGELVIPANVTTIGSHAFVGCTNLESISIPDSVTTIGEGAFYGCNRLTSIVIPDSVTTIGYRAFYGCYKLIEVYNQSELEIVAGSEDNGFVAYYALNVYTEEGGNKLSTDEDGYIIYTDGDDKIMVGYVGDETELVIPNGIKTIYGYAFSGCSSLTSITIPDSVTSVGSSAFAGCSNLTSITLPFVNVGMGGTHSYVDKLNGYGYHFGMLFGTESYEGATEVVHKYSFVYSLDTFNITTTYYVPASLTTITILRGTICKDAFYGCSTITTLTIGEKVTDIGTDAFQGCSGLTTVNLWENCRTSIDWDAFSDCDNLTNVYYLGTLEQWCGKSFASGSKNNPMYYVDNFYIDGELVEGELVIPDGVTHIGSYAFYSCDNLTSVTIPASVTIIGYGAFEGCSNLTSITFEDTTNWHVGKSAIDVTDPATNVTYFTSTYYDYNWFKPDENGFVITNEGAETTLVVYFGTATEVVVPANVTSIGYGAFQDCDSLTSVTFGENSQLTTIGVGAFFGCSGLTSITIPSSVTSIGSTSFYDMTFYGCYRLVEVYNMSNLSIVAGSSDNGSVAYYALNVYTEEGGSKLSTDEDGYIFYTDGDEKILVGYVGDETELTIPDDITAINQYAFYNCTRLTSVTFGENSQLTSIGNNAFRDCDSLTSITIPDSVTNIGHRAFYDCTNLTSVTIGSGVTSIGDDAFYGCTSLMSITVDETNQNYQSIAGNLYSKDGKTLIQYAVGKPDTSFTIPDSVTTIDEYAFYGCDSLTSITIPANVTTIGWGAFYGCNSLTDVYYTGTEEQWNAISIGSNDPLTNAARRYYSECVHDNNYWRYDADGNISTELTVGDWVVDTEPTCTTNGSKHRVCNVCGETVTAEIPVVHSIGDDGVCTICGEVFYTIKNDETNAFVETDGILQSTNHADGSSSGFIITANTTITIAFEYNVSSDSSDWFIIALNGVPQVAMSGTSNSYTSYSITLEAGDALWFVYSKDDGVSSGDDCCYIKNLTITTASN